MIEDCWRKTNTYFHFALHVQLGAKPAVIKICCAKVFLCDFHPENLMNSLKKDCSHHPTLFQWASEFWRVESRSLLANWIAPNSAAYFPPLLSIHRASAKTSDPLPFRLCIYLLTVLNSFHHLSNSVVKALCCFFLPIFMVLSLSFTPCSAFTLFLWAHSLFWSIRAVSSSCFCSTPSLSIPLTDFSFRVLQESELHSWTASESHLLLQHKILLNL